MLTKDLPLIYLFFLPFDLPKVFFEFLSFFGGGGFVVLFVVVVVVVVAVVAVVI